MEIATSKPEAAVRQLDVAVKLLFSAREPLAVRTLAAAAQAILADLVELKLPGDSWRSRLIESSGLSRRAALKVLNAASNFLKRADSDATADLVLDEEENDHVIFFATLECGELGYPLSLTMQAFQAWYLACHPQLAGDGNDLSRLATAVFPKVLGLERAARLREGALFLPRMHLSIGDQPNPSFQRTAARPLN